MLFRKHRRITVVAVVVALGAWIGSWSGYAYLSLPGVIPPSGCSVGAVLSTDQFTSTGFSNVRTVGPGDEAPAGAWVLADDFVPSTSIIGTTNCPMGAPPDGWPLFVVGLRLTPTIGSWQEADIQELKLVLDSNLDGLYDEGLDPVLQIRKGEELRASQSVTFFNGPQAPIVVVPSGGATGILVVVKIGPNPRSGSQFGLMLEAATADVPTMGIISSAFSSSRNPQGSSIRLHIIGGTGANPQPPLTRSRGLQALDSNGNCHLDDSEFFQAIDAWVQGQLDNDLFFRAIDAWIQKTDLCMTATAQPREKVTLQFLPSGVVFATRDSRVMAMEAHIYDLKGQEVFQGSSSEGILHWSIASSGLASHPLANGIYLATVKVLWRDGTVSEERYKIPIVR